MLRSIFDNVVKGNFSDFKGSVLTLSMPISVERLNSVLKSAAEGNDVIEKLEVVSIHQDLVTFQVSLGQFHVVGNRFDLIDRELILRLHPVLHDPDFVLKIEVVDGIRRFENELLELLFSKVFNKSEKLDFNDRVLMVNHQELSDHPIYNGLLRYLSHAHLNTKTDYFEYQLEFRF